MTRNAYRYVRVASLACGSLLSLPAAVSAAESTAGFQIEEIVVTARKREEDLQDVPVAVTAFNATQIDAMMGSNIGELSKFTPNVILARQPYAGNALFGGIRGIVFGDLEKSFDPTVGVVIDGVPMVTNTSALIDTFDLESIEILRGPQGTLFGRNTIAGVVNARRTRPTKEFGLKTQARYGSHNEQKAKVLLNLGNSKNFGVKLGVFRDKGDGYTEDADFDLATGAINGSGHDTDGEDTWNYVASALWEPTDKLSLLFTYDYGDDKSTLATPTNLTTPNLDAALRGAITGQLFTDLGSGVPPGAAVGGAIGATLGSGGNFCDVYSTTFAPLNGWVNDIACASQGYLRGEADGYKYSYTAVPFQNRIKRSAYTLEGNYDLTDKLTLTSITGYSSSDEELDEDNLGAAVPIFNPVRPQDYEQQSTELRLTSNYDGKLNFVGGLYYVYSKYKITQSIWVFGSQFLGAPPSPDGDAGQETTSYAAYGEAYYDITDKLRLTVGGRYTYEEKNFWIFQRDSADGTGLLPVVWGCGDLSGGKQALANASGAAWIAGAPDQATADARAAALVCNDDDGEKDWDNFTPKAVLDYRFTDTLMAYTSFAKGYRSGGWNGRATTPSSIGPYNAESVDSYELGVRSELFDRTLRLNLTGFLTQYTDKQESEIFQFGIATETLVQNAGDAEVKGFELESQWVPTDKWEVRLAVGYNNGEYKKFIANNSATGLPEDRSDTYEFAFAPEWNYNAGINYYQSLDKWGMGSAIFRSNYAWADKTVGNFGQPDPQGLGRNEFDSRGVWDFSLEWDSPWVQVTGFVKNAFEDDNYLATSVNVGVFWFGATAPGRTYGIELTKVW